MHQGGSTSRTPARTAITRRDGSRLDVEFLGGLTTVAGTRYVFVCVWSIGLA